MTKALESEWNMYTCHVFLIMNSFWAERLIEWQVSFERNDRTKSEEEDHQVAPSRSTITKWGSELENLKKERLWILDIDDNCSDSCGLKYPKKSSQYLKAL